VQRLPDATGEAAPYLETQSMKTISLVLLFCFVAGSWALYGQALPTASKRFDLQAGGDFVLDSSDYSGRYRGAGIYATLDFSPHFGTEVDFHQANLPGGLSYYERTYEAGGRYHRTYGPFEPYAKFLYLRGVFNFVYPNNALRANLAYNGFALGGGTDLRITPWLNLRGDYEYQDWSSFQVHGLSPQLVSFGVAYHFPSGMQKSHRVR